MQVFEPESRSPPTRRCRRAAPRSQRAAAHGRAARGARKRDDAETVGAVSAQSAGSLKWKDFGRVSVS